MSAARSAASSARTLRPSAHERLRTSIVVAAAYLAATLYCTWPLPRGLTRDVPSDLGDSLLNMWILSWDVEQLRLLFTGDLSVVSRWFDANIFHPAPLSLAYSEHLLAQAIQIFPVHLLTANPILSYNVLFLSTYVLSGLGMYLLVRELTHNRRAAFVAGLIFAFVPYRIPQASHLQVLSSQWMPFTLWGLTRYLDTRRRRALVGATLSLFAQAMSSGYYLIYFTLFVVAYVVWELVRRGRWRDRRTWLDLAIASAACLALLTPFLIPYARLHAQNEMSRGLAEVSHYSADVYAYFTAFPIQRFWGRLLQIYPHGEGELFMGALPLALGAVGAVWLPVAAWRVAPLAPASRWPYLARAFGVIALIALALVIGGVFARRISVDVAGLTLRVTNLARPMIVFALAVAGWLACSPRARSCVRSVDGRQAFFVMATIGAWWLSLGPTPTSHGGSLDLPAPYRLLYLVPGADGLRVPARLAMVVALMLAVVSGFVLARLPRGRHGSMIAALVCALFLFEAPAWGFALNGVTRTPGFGMPDDRVYPPATAPAVYRDVARLADSTVVLELPIGDPNWDVRAVYYSMVHWRPIVNGYSGFVPAHYGSLIARLNTHERAPAEARAALSDSGATHVLVHDQGFSLSDAAGVHRWLLASGARILSEHRGDRLYAVDTR